MELTAKLEGEGQAAMIKPSSAVTIYSNNQGAIALAKNPTNHARTKHIDIQHHFVRSYAKSLGLIQRSRMEDKNDDP